MNNDDTKNRWQHGPAEAWLPYEPTPTDPWNLSKVLRLHRRAGLGATWRQVQRDLNDGHKAAIRRMLDGADQGPDRRAAESIRAFCDAMFDSYRTTGGLDPVRTAWFYRLVFSPWPLRERMILAWHTHYATSETKTYEKDTLVDQHLTQRELWRAPISRLHLAMLRDRAMLYWLDGAANRRGAINENLGREFLELFALGVGNYSEQDVRETARALTGWQRIYERQQPLKYMPALHDPGQMTILGQSGNWNDQDVVRIACAHPAAARRIAWRLWRTFISNVDHPPDDLLEPLAAAMRVDGDVDIARGLDVLLHSRLFHSEAYAGRSVLAPAVWTATVLRSGETFPPHPDLLMVAAAAQRMGQRLFQPPNVAGWPGGMEWLTSPALVARANFAAWLTSDESQVPADHWNKLVERYEIKPGETELDFWTALFWGAVPTDQQRGRLAAQIDNGKSDDRAATVRAVLTAASAHLA